MKYKFYDTCSLLMKANHLWDDEWCQDHNIPLIRIPYTKYETLTLSDLLI